MGNKITTSFGSSFSNSFDLNLHMETEGFEAGESFEFSLYYDDHEIVDGREKIDFQAVVQKDMTVKIKEIFKNHVINIIV